MRLPTVRPRACCSAGSLGDLQMTQAALADSAAEVDAAALLVYRAAWTKDIGAERITRELSIAKMFATEIGQKVVDRAVQIFGGNGVRVGSKAEALYREIRALRIYEGATEVQKVVIARELMKSRAGRSSPQAGDAHDHTRNRKFSRDPDVEPAAGERDQRSA